MGYNLQTGFVDGIWLFRYKKDEINIRKHNTAPFVKSCQTKIVPGTKHAVFKQRAKSHFFTKIVYYPI